MSIKQLIQTFCACFLCTMQVGSAEQSDFPATIPVVDLNDFHNPETKQAFVDQVSEALHEYGFFAVVNAGIDPDVFENAYDATTAFFQAPHDLKEEIYDPSLNGQRGYVPGETAQGSTVKDCKEYLHIGRTNNLWPGWMELQEPVEQFMKALDQHGETLVRAFALAIHEEEEFFLEMTREGECLLRPLHYPPVSSPKTPWAAQHTDIDLFTILPRATQDGLEIFHRDEWLPVIVPPNAVIINGGDKLENLTNGYFKSALHRVTASADVERFSIVYFVHSRNDDPMDPTETCIQMTGGVQRFPNATSLELLACRLRELGIASPELLQFEQESGILERIRELVELGNAAPAVQFTWDEWCKSREMRECK